MALRLHGFLSNAVKLCPFLHTFIHLLQNVRFAENTSTVHRRGGKTPLELCGCAPSKRGVCRQFENQLLRRHFEPVTPKSFQPLGTSHAEVHHTRHTLTCFVFHLPPPNLCIRGKFCKALGKSKAARACSCWGLRAGKIFRGSTFLLDFWTKKQRRHFFFFLL